MHARSRHIRVEWRVFNQRDVGDGSAAHQCAFKQVMAQNLARGESARQHLVHGLHIEQAFAGERAFAKNVLVDF